MFQFNSIEIAFPAGISSGISSEISSVVGSSTIVFDKVAEPSKNHM